MKDLSQIRRDALAIFTSAVAAVDPGEAIRRHVQVEGNRLAVQQRTYDLSNYENVFVVGGGKAGAAMAKAIEELLPNRIRSGRVNVKYGHRVPLRVVQVTEAGHPVPDDAGLRGTLEIIKLLQETGKRDLIFCLISGGGSALLPCPAEGLTLEAKRDVTQQLLACGATIGEINAVRKHISQIKGGRLARLANPSTVISLILSDVIGDDLSSIASGPAVPDGSTFKDCLEIVCRYQIEKKIPASVLAYLERGARGEVEETPKPHEHYFANTQNVIVGNNRIAIEAGKEKASALGYHTLVLSSFMEGETKEVGKVHAAIAKEILSSEDSSECPACVISGGETTVTLRGHGLGGRNQEFVLTAAIEIEGLERTVILSGGTDGTDGPTDAAGAIADGLTIQRAREKGLDAQRYLENNDSYHFFQPLGDLIVTGPTKTNVMDFRLVLVG